MRQSRTSANEAFLVNNAKRLTIDQLVRTFVPIDSFWKAISADHNLIVGSRGSGKTAISKMISHTHLARFAETNDKAKGIVKDASHIGMYAPTTLYWVGGLNNKPWLSETDVSAFFQWRLNVSTSMSFLESLRSCLKEYIPNVGNRARTERDLIKEISLMWSMSEIECDSIVNLNRWLTDIESHKQIQINDLRVTRRKSNDYAGIGRYFETDLYTPIRRAIDLTTAALQLPKDAAWMICLDEAEFLDQQFQRIINSHLRPHSGNLFFKITTLPYTHTNETNSAVALDAGHDYTLLYIDQDPTIWDGKPGREGVNFVNKVIEKQLSAMKNKYLDLQPQRLLGMSELLDPFPTKWSDTSSSWKRLLLYANETTLARARKLRDKSPPEFRNEIGRKLHGALLLKECVENEIGRRQINIYSGLTMVVRCGDGNPKRILKLFKCLLDQLDEQNKKNRNLRKLTPFDDGLLARKTQSTALIGFSGRELSYVRSESRVGPETFELLTTLGEYFYEKLHDAKIGVDQYFSIEIDSKVTDREWRLVRKAVTLGLLYPSIQGNLPAEVPYREGRFRLAYVLAPHFRLMPRKGKAVNLSSILDTQISLEV